MRKAVRVKNAALFKKSGRKYLDKKDLMENELEEKNVVSQKFCNSNNFSKLWIKKFIYALSIVLRIGQYFGRDGKKRDVLKIGTDIYLLWKNISNIINRRNSRSPDKTLINLWITI